jgi:hypothetical protein
MTVVNKHEDGRTWFARPVKGTSTTELFDVEEVEVMCVEIIGDDRIQIVDEFDTAWDVNEHEFEFQCQGTDEWIDTEDFLDKVLD